MRTRRSPAMAIARSRFDSRRLVHSRRFSRNALHLLPILAVNRGRPLFPSSLIPWTPPRIELDQDRGQEFHRGSNAEVWEMAGRGRQVLIAPFIDVARDHIRVIVPGHWGH